MGTFLKITGFAICTWLAAGWANAAVEYTVTPLGGFEPHAMNNRGEAVGFSQDPKTGYCTAVLYSGGKLYNIGSLGGTYNVANAINDSGLIVGVSTTSGGVYHSFSCRKGVMADLGTLGGVGSFAYGIDDAGDIVGSVNTMGINCSGFLLKNGNVFDLGGLGGTRVSAAAINSAGQIVGASNTQDGSEHAFIYQNGLMTDIGALGGNSMGSAINDNGQIVGQSETSSGVVHAFLYSDGEMLDIGQGNVISAALAINNNGQVVGAITSLNHAFVYEDGEMIDLNTLITESDRLTLCSGVGINDAGQILAGGFYSGDLYGSAFLLTPIPEPAIGAHAIMCFVALTAGFCVTQRRHERTSK
jgi:probable HAF family extracellular repeat protein